MDFYFKVFFLLDIKLKLYIFKIMLSVFGLILWKKKFFDRFM